MLKSIPLEEAIALLLSGADVLRCYPYDCEYLSIRDTFFGIYNEEELLFAYRTCRFLVEVE